MVQINFAKREVQCKVVYYGPAQSGKTTNLRSIHDRAPEHVRGAFTTIATDTNRTLFFDFLPLNLGQVAGIGTKVHLYAIPYILNQNALRLLVLEGVDGIVFVADSSRARLADNIEALENLRENVAHLGRELADIPIVFQWNKSDEADALPQAELERELNPGGAVSFAAMASSGGGVFSTLKAMTQRVLEDIAKVVAAPMAQAAASSAPPASAPVREESAPARVGGAPFAGAPTPPARPPAAEPAPFTPAWRRAPEPPPPPPEQREFEAAEEPSEEFEQVAALPQPEPPDYRDPYEPPAFIRAAAQDLDTTPPPVQSRRAPRQESGAPAWSRRSDPVPVLGAPSEPARRPGAGRARSGPLPRRVGESAASWEQHRADTAAEEDFPRRRVGTQPAVDRRQRSRGGPAMQPIPAASLVAGTAFTVIALIAIGYLVFQLL